LVIVTGLTGSGKTSTIAAMINHINRNHHKHVVTIEGPIEYLHRDINCSITQREVGVDTESFSGGLGAALRQDPDVVVIGEIRDPETLDLALKGAEMGHLVIAALPSPDVMSALTRLLGMFPRDERQVGRLRLADTIRAVIAQQLLVKKDGEGRIAAIEVLTSSTELRTLLKKSDGLDLIRNLISDAQEPGTQSLEDHLVQLVDEGHITQETARAAVADPDSLHFGGGKGKKKSKN
jgi:twitching motility protein PilT